MGASLAVTNSLRDMKKDWPLREGPDALVMALVKGAPVRLGQRVERIDWSDNGVTVRLQSGSLRARALEGTSPRPSP